MPIAIGVLQEFGTEEQARSVAKEWLQQKIFPKTRKRKGNGLVPRELVPVKRTAVARHAKKTHRKSKHTLGKQGERNRVVRFICSQCTVLSPTLSYACQVKARYRAVAEARCKIGELGGDAFNSLVELLGEGHISVNMSDLQQQKKGSGSQKTLSGTTASARAAKNPAMELYDRLGLQHCLPREMRTKFLESSVHEITDRRRSCLIRVATPLVKVGPSSRVTHNPNPNPNPHKQEIFQCLTPDWRTALTIVSRNIQFHQRLRLPTLYRSISLYPIHT